MSAKGSEVSFLGFERAVAHVGGIEDAVKRRLVTFGLTISLNRVIAGSKPANPFDLLYFVESIGELFEAKDQIAQLVSLPVDPRGTNSTPDPRVNAARSQFQNLAMNVVARRIGRGELPEGEFDMPFFSATMGELFDERATLKAVQEGRDLRWFEDEG